jgi:hypothetical protein
MSLEFRTGAPKKKLFGSDLPPFLTISEIVASVGDIARQNLAKTRAPHTSEPAEDK